MPAGFVVRLNSSFERDLKKLLRQIQVKVVEALRALEANPFGPPPKIKNLKGEGAGKGGLRLSGPAPGRS